MSIKELLKKIDLSGLSGREKFILGLTVGVILYGLLNYIYLPKYKETRLLSLQILSLNGENAELSNKIIDLTKKKNEMIQSKNNRSAVDGDGINGILRGKKKLSLFLKEVIRLSRIEDIDFISVKPNIAEEKERIREVLFRFDLKSGFEELGGYLKRLEEMNLVIKDIKLHSNSDLDSNINSELNAMVYMVKK